MDELTVPGTDYGLGSVGEFPSQLPKLSRTIVGNDFKCK